jgi:hypothetical protein
VLSKDHGTNLAWSFCVNGKSMQQIRNRNRESRSDEIDKGLKLKKQESRKMAKKKRVLLRSYWSQPLGELRNNHTRHEIGMGILWVVLAALCGALGWVLLTILLK